MKYIVVVKMTDGKFISIMEPDNYHIKDFESRHDADQFMQKHILRGGNVQILEVSEA